MYTVPFPLIADPKLVTLFVLYPHNNPEKGGGRLRACEWPKGTQKLPWQSRV